MPQPDDDPRTAFVYQEALRGLIQQQTMVDGLHMSAGTLIFAASFASSLLGSRALSDGLQAWDWTAVGLLFAIGALAVTMLWPYYNFWSRFDVEELLSRYVDAEAPATMTEMHRALALCLKGYQQRNQRIIRRIGEAFQLSLILLLLEILPGCSLSRPCTLPSAAAIHDGVADCLRAEQRDVTTDLANVRSTALADRQRAKAQDSAFS